MSIVAQLCVQRRRRRRALDCPISDCHARGPSLDGGQSDGRFFAADKDHFCDRRLSSCRVQQQILWLRRRSRAASASRSKPYRRALGGAPRAQRFWRQSQANRKFTLAIGKIRRRKIAIRLPKNRSLLVDHKSPVFIASECAESFLSKVHRT